MCHIWFVHLLKISWFMLAVGNYLKSLYISNKYPPSTVLVKYAVDVFWYIKLFLKIMLKYIQHKFYYLTVCV